MVDPELMIERNRPGQYAEACDRVVMGVRKGIYYFVGIAFLG